MAQPVERRLVTILAADIAEYSRLMRADEDAAFAALTQRRAVADALIAAHKGRIANTAGDAILAEFPSVSDGLLCALAIQEAIAKENEAVPSERRMHFRIGVHLGDVMIRDGDLYGDAVNIAARLEGLAEPGTVFVSNTVHEHVRDRLPFAFEDLGERQVKNIARPLRVFRVALTHPGANAPGSPLSRSAGEGAERSEAGEGGSPALALPDKPSIAVLPFANMSSDPEQEFLADGIAEDIITALSRFPSLFVIARNSSFTYKGRAVDVKEVGRELGVRYVLEGSLRKSGSRIRVTAQLVEAETGRHVWAERYDRDLADIFAVQDEISEAVTIAVAPAVAEAELHRAMRKPPQNLDAWAAYQRGLWHQARFTVEDNRLAQQFFQQAIDRDPNFAGGYIGLSANVIIAATSFATVELAEASSCAERLGRRALALDPANAEGHCCLGWGLLVRGDLNSVLSEADRALALCPNLAWAHQIRGAALTLLGRPREGLTVLGTAIRLDPRSPTRAIQLLQIAVSHYFCREYEAAVEVARQVTRSYPDWPPPYRWLAAALGQLGRTEEAKPALEQAISIAPASFERHIRGGLPFFRPEDHAHLLDGLRKAGWQG